MSLKVQDRSALDFLLLSEVGVSTTLSLSAVSGLQWESAVAFSADLLVDLVLSGESSECGLDLELSHTTTSKSEDQMESGLLLNVVIRESSSIFELLTSEDESLLIGWNAFLILEVVV